ncbi:uncharacterized protein LOC143453673 [Clavelina lepadiformis]|uniref:G-protein coupled receptors family 1 profile domain-containing protein n=1 Tax=Clavelina lepadiformis TaxID=159417 RepID=A0ABP0FW73_CLALP
MAKIQMYFNNGTDDFIRTNASLAIAFIVMETIMLIGGVYLFTTLCIYLKEIFQEKCSSADSLRRKRIRLLLCGLATLSTLAASIKFALAQWTYYVPEDLVAQDPLKYCIEIAQIFQPVHCVGFLMIYVFLWLRQYSFYSEPFLECLSNKYINAISWTLLASILLVGVSGTVASVYTVTEEEFIYINGTNACAFKEHTGPNAVIVYTGYSLIIFVQGCLALLFFYITRRYQMNMKRSDISGTNRLQVLLRNCSVAAIVSVTTDLAVTILDWALKEKVYELVQLGIWDIAYAINLACILFCFSNWKQIVCPWSKQKNGERKQSCVV